MFLVRQCKTTTHLVAIVRQNNELKLRCNVTAPQRPIFIWINVLVQLY